MNQLLLALRFYATGSFQMLIGDTIGVHKTTVCRILHEVMAAIASLRPKYVRFPSTADERNRTMQQFYAASGMPGVLGAIDCTHVPIQSPGGDDAEIYRNRKSYFSVNVQLVCDQTGCMTDVVARWPGSVHDSTIFDNSYVRAELETKAYKGHLVGDSAYPCRRYLLTPVPNPTTEPEKAYNCAQISARNVIERANGILKRRFPALKYGLHLRLDHTLPAIVAAVILNNIALVMGDDVPPEDEELSQFMHKLQNSENTGDFEADEAGPAQHVVAQNARSIAVRQAVINSHFV